MQRLQRGHAAHSVLSFPGASIPARSKRQKRHLGRWKSTLRHGPQRRGGLLGVLSVARGAQKQGLVAAPYLTIRRGSAEAQLYYW